jgi:hypothetical protein
VFNFDINEKTTFLQGEILFFDTGVRVVRFFPKNPKKKLKNGKWENTKKKLSKHCKAKVLFLIFFHAIFKTKMPIFSAF